MAAPSGIEPSTTGFGPQLDQPEWRQNHIKTLHWCDQFMLHDADYAVPFRVPCWSKQTVTWTRGESVLIWCLWLDSNQHATLFAPAPQAGVYAIPPQRPWLVVSTGVEPVTSWMSTKRSTAELRNWNTLLVLLYSVCQGESWCARWDSNSQSFRHWLLRPACIPFHH